MLVAGFYHITYNHECSYSLQNCYYYPTRRVVFRYASTKIVPLCLTCLLWLILNHKRILMSIAQIEYWLDLDLLDNNAMFAASFHVIPAGMMRDRIAVELFARPSGAGIVWQIRLLWQLSSTEMKNAFFMQQGLLLCIINLKQNKFWWRKSEYFSNVKNYCDWINAWIQNIHTLSILLF